MASTTADLPLGRRWFFPVEATLEYVVGDGAVLVWRDPTLERAAEWHLKRNRPEGGGNFNPFQLKEWWRRVFDLGEAMEKPSGGDSAAVAFLRAWGPLTANWSDGSESLSALAAGAIQFKQAVDLSALLMFARQREREGKRGAAADAWERLRGLLGPREPLPDRSGCYWTTLPRWAPAGLQLFAAEQVTGPTPVFTSAGAANPDAGLPPSTPEAIHAQVSAALARAMEGRIGRVAFTFDNTMFPPAPVLEPDRLIDAAWLQWLFQYAPSGVRRLECGKCGTVRWAPFARRGDSWRCPQCRQDANTAVKRATRARTPQRERLHNALHKTLHRHGLAPTDPLYRQAIATLETLERREPAGHVRAALQEWLFEHGLRHRRR